MSGETHYDITEDDAARLIGVTPLALAKWREMRAGPSCVLRDGQWYYYDEIVSYRRAFQDLFSLISVCGVDGMIAAPPKPADLETAAKKRGGR